MNEQDVTRVTRNRRSVPPEVKLLVDIIASIAMIYYVTHPDCIDGVRPAIRKHWSRVVHRVSVWTATQDIRSLPETDSD